MKRRTLISMAVATLCARVTRAQPPIIKPVGPVVSAIPSSGEKWIYNADGKISGYAEWGPSPVGNTWNFGPDNFQQPVPQGYSPGIYAKPDADGIIGFDIDMNSGPVTFHKHTGPYPEGTTA